MPENIFEQAVLVVFLIILFLADTLEGRETKGQRAIGGREEVAPQEGAQALTYYCTDPKILTREFLDWVAPRPRWRELPALSPGQRVSWLAGMTTQHTFPENPAILKAIMDSRQLTDKVLLHGYSSELPGLLADTFEVSGDSRLPQEGKPWIVRANWGWAGSANRVVVSTSELREAYAALSERPKNFKQRTRGRVIASAYIEDPMLLDTGHKFHARVHVYAQMGPRVKRRACILPTIYLMSSEIPYHPGDWKNPEIHDTHGRYRGGFRALLETLPGADILREKTVASTRALFEVMLPRLKPYGDAENAYEFYGLDIMYLRDGTPIILEVNNNVGTKATPEMEDSIHAEMLREVAACVREVFGEVSGEDSRGKESAPLIPPGVLPRGIGLGNLADSVEIPWRDAPPAI